MRVVILAVGSRGDVEPFVALSRRLAQSGHQVRLATHVEFRDLVTRYAVEFSELPGNPRNLLSTPEGQALLRTRSPLSMVKGLGDLVGPTFEQTYPYAERAAAGADIVVFSTLALVGLNVADRLGVPTVSAHLQPFQATREFPSASVPIPRRLPRMFNRASWLLSERLAWRAFVPALNAQRCRLGLADLPVQIPSRWPRGERATGLFGYSASVVPIPADWPDDVQVTGYWFNDPPEGWAPPGSLVDFLAAGAAPVYLGFGSMGGGNPDEVSRILVEAARRVGRRSVLSTGWAGLGVADADDVLVVDDLPHSWLLPRVAAVVHHGGAGTTAAVLRAGAPSVIVPHFADQFFWARRVHLLGAAPAPVRVEKLGADLLADRLRAALGPDTVQAAQSVAEKLRHEDGAGAAVRVIERVGRS